MEVRKMQSLALLFAIFFLSFVAGIGWYAGRATVQFVAGVTARRGTKPAGREEAPPANSEKKTLRIVE